jgi:hypothetical protein
VFFHFIPTSTTLATLIFPSDISLQMALHFSIHPTHHELLSLLKSQYSLARNYSYRTWIQIWTFVLAGGNSEPGISEFVDAKDALRKRRVWIKMPHPQE